MHHKIYFFAQGVTLDENLSLKILIEASFMNFFKKIFYGSFYGFLL